MGDQPACAQPDVQLSQKFRHVLEQGSFHVCRDVATVDDENKMTNDVMMSMMFMRVKIPFCRILTEKPRSAAQIGPNIPNQWPRSFQVLRSDGPVNFGEAPAESSAASGRDPAGLLTVFTGHWISWKQPEISFGKTHQGKSFNHMWTREQPWVLWFTQHFSKSRKPEHQLFLHYVNLKVERCESHRECACRRRAHRADWTSHHKLQPG